MTTIYIDNQPHTVVNDKANLLVACLNLGFDIPYFCWHPALHSVGACRQCAVKLYQDENDRQGKIVMSCMTAIRDGMRISIDDPEVREFRRSVIEWLMLNHPHDCPVCDEGGECHLQDMTVLAGHVGRRTRFPKRTCHNQDLGPFLHHEMNRCIHCYRCVRYYRGFAGGRDLYAMGWHDHVYFGRHRDGVLASPFAGNLVEVCPTGVFTDKTFRRHFVRKWDLQTAPSICVHCSLGCNTIPGERYGLLRRIRARYHNEVNGYFLCDRGRFGYEFVNSDRRIRQGLLGREGRQEPAGVEGCLDRAAELLRTGRAVGIGSTRATLESNYALRELVGADRFCLGLCEQELRLARECASVLRQGDAPSASLKEAAASDAVLVLGEDPLNGAPLLALALRQAALQKPLEDIAARKFHPWADAVLRQAIQLERGPMYLFGVREDFLDHDAAVTYRSDPTETARMGFAIAHFLDPDSPAVNDLPENQQDVAALLAQALRRCKRPLVVSGTHSGQMEVLHAAANVAWALRRTGLPGRLFLALGECNTMGAALMDSRGGLTAARDLLRRGEADTLVVMENDILRQAGSAQGEELLGLAKHLIVLDHMTTPTSLRADVVLPAATFAEGDGTLVNNEARAQRSFRVMNPDPDIREGWRWAGELMARLGRPGQPWPNLDAVLEAMARDLPALAGAKDAAPPADFRIQGMRVPRQPFRYSGRTAMHAPRFMREPPPPADPDSPLAYSMEGYPGRPDAALITEYWAPNWNSCNAVNKYQAEIGGPLKGGDAGVRLIAPAAGPADYFTDVPPPFQPRPDQWLLVACRHVFGSEELSALAPGIASLTPPPYVLMSDKDIARLALASGQVVRIEAGDLAQELPVHSSRTMPPGLAALPIDLPGMDHIGLPAWGTIQPAGEVL